MKNFIPKLALLVLSALVLLASLQAGASPVSPQLELPATLRVSVASDGTQAQGGAHGPAPSANGRYVAFVSDATNLVGGIVNGYTQIYIHDLWIRHTELVSLSTSGEPGNEDSSRPTVSADGRFVAFYSSASDLVPGDSNARHDVFVFDRHTRTTERVSVSSSGVEGDGESYLHRFGISADGRYVAFYSFSGSLVEGDTNLYNDVFVHDRQTRITERISVSSAGVEGNGNSLFPAISADGRFVSFYSHASTLVEGDDNGFSDVFLHDRLSGETVLVSTGYDGSPANGNSELQALSSDGRWMAFSSEASNLVPGDTNSSSDIFVFDRQSGTISRVSVSSDGNQAQDNSDLPAISGDGRYVAFYSYAENLVQDDSNQHVDVFVHDRRNDETERVSVSTSGEEGDHDSLCACMSADGRLIAFYSFARNLVEDDTNNQSDVFVRLRWEDGERGRLYFPLLAIVEPGD